MTAAIRRRASIAGAAAVLVLVGIVFGICWHISDLIDETALTPSRGPAPGTARVVEVTDTTVLISANGDANALSPGLWGVQWRDPPGYAQVGEILAIAGTSTTVTRARIDGWPAPPVGTAVRFDSFAFAPDPTVRGVPFTNVTYEAPGGPAPAWAIDGASDTWVIFVHGKGADRREALRMLPVVHALHLPALVIAYRNDPDAPADRGGRFRYGATEWEDLDAAARYATQQGAKHVVLVGHSMGGAIVLAFMERSSLAPRVRGLILDAPATDLRQMLVSGVEHAGVPSPLAQIAVTLVAVRRSLDYGATNYLDRAAEVRVPVLLFHGAEDDFIPVALSDRFAGLRPDLVEYHRVAGANHTRSWNLDPATYESAVRDFLGRSAGP